MEGAEKSEEPEIKTSVYYFRIIRDAIIFYTTAFFVLLLIFRYIPPKLYLALHSKSIKIFCSCVSFCFLVPFVIGEYLLNDDKCKMQSEIGWALTLFVLSLFFKSRSD